MSRMTKGEMNRLGDRIRAAGGLDTEEDRDLLERVLAEHLDVLAVAVERVREGLLLDVEPTPRLKSDKTLVEKLLREPGMDLARVEDIAGIRIVRDMTWREQDKLASRIARLFDAPKIINRRDDPRSGYRAIHVRVSLESRLVEVQVRTQLQNAWAQTYEALGDVWGRQIRYGEPPDDADRPVPGDGSRGEFIRQVLKVSDLIAEHESTINRLVDLEVELDEKLEPSADEPDDLMEALMDDLEAVREQSKANRASLRDGLSQLLEVVEVILETGVD